MDESGHGRESSRQQTRRLGGRMSRSVRESAAESSRLTPASRDASSGLAGREVPATADAGDTARNVARSSRQASRNPAGATETGGERRSVTRTTVMVTVDEEEQENVVHSTVPPGRW